MQELWEHAAAGEGQEDGLEKGGEEEAAAENQVVVVTVAALVVAAALGALAATSLDAVAAVLGAAAEAAAETELELSGWGVAKGQALAAPAAAIHQGPLALAETARPEPQLPLRCPL